MRKRHLTCDTLSCAVAVATTAARVLVLDAREAPLHYCTIEFLLIVWGTRVRSWQHRVTAAVRRSWLHMLDELILNKNVGHTCWYHLMRRGTLRYLVKKYACSRQQYIHKYLC